MKNHPHPGEPPREDVPLPLGVEVTNAAQDVSACRASSMAWQASVPTWRPEGLPSIRKKPALRRAFWGFGSPGWIRTTECLSQSQVPYRLATGL